MINFNLEEGTLVEITWNDIIMDSGWTDISDIKVNNPPECKDVGWFINQDDLNIRICNSMNSDNEGSYSIIPKGVVRKIRRI
jgi:hypothetical protein